VPLHFCQKLIHLEILIFIQVEFLQFETDYNDKDEMFWFLKLITIIARDNFGFEADYND
jgi:hypothetical protein